MDLLLNGETKEYQAHLLDQPRFPAALYPGCGIGWTLFDYADNVFDTVPIVLS
jgi:hypothetical protein